MEEQYKGTLYLNMSHDEYKKDIEEAFLAGRGSSDSFDKFYETRGDADHAES